MLDLIIQLIAGMVGTLGFALIFHVRHKYMIMVASGGFLCWLVYVLALNASGSESVFLPTLISGFVTAMYAELLARICHAPSTVFFQTSVIPLIPGKLLFQCVQAMVEGDHKVAQHNGAMTFQTALGIALGMSIAWTICYMSRKIRGRIGAV